MLVWVSKNWKLLKWKKTNNWHLFGQYFTGATEMHILRKKKIVFYFFNQNITNYHNVRNYKLQTALLICYQVVTILWLTLFQIGSEKRIEKSFLAPETSLLFSFDYPSNKTILDLMFVLITMKKRKKKNTHTQKNKTKKTQLSWMVFVNYIKI